MAVKEFLLRGELSSLDDTGGIAEDRKRPAGGDARVQLAQRPGRGVAGIGKRRLTVFFFLGIDLLKGLQRQEDFATHLQQAGISGHPKDGVATS